MEHSKTYVWVKHQLMAGQVTRKEAEEIAQIAWSRARLPETREVRFYMSEDGEVLSNKRFPVTFETMLMQDIHDPAGPPPPLKHFKAQKIKVPA